MTKCYKIDADLYKFVNEDNEDNKTVEVIKGDALAQIKIDAINKRAIDDTEFKKRRDGDIRNNFWDVVSFIEQTDIDAFKTYLKTIKQKSEIKLQTGRMIFNQQKYDAAMGARQKEYEKITRDATALLNNPTRENLERVNELMRQRKEIENTRILKDAAQFNDPEYVTIRMTAIEALNVVLSKINDYRKDDDAAKQHAIDVEITNERMKFENISETDFQLIKQLKRLVSTNAFFNMFEYSVVEKYRDCLSFDSIEEYINRPRDPQYEHPVLQFNETDMQAINYMKQLIRDYNTYCEYERLKAAL